MGPVLQKLGALANSWGGSIREVTPEEWSKIAGLEVIGVGYWRMNPVRGFSLAPFSSRDLGVFWRRKQVVFSGQGDWPEVIHEMAHVFASNKKPDLAEEWPFLGWEYAVAKYVEGPLKDWYSYMRDYMISKDGDTFGDLSPSQRHLLCQKRLQVARDLKLVVGDVPQSIR